MIYGSEIKWKISVVTPLNPFGRGASQTPITNVRRGLCTRKFQRCICRSTFLINACFCRSTYWNFLINCVLFQTFLISRLLMDPKRVICNCIQYLRQRTQAAVRDDSAPICKRRASCFSGISLLVWSLLFLQLKLLTVRLLRRMDLIRWMMIMCVE